MAGLNRAADAVARRFRRSVIVLTALGLALRVAYVSFVVADRPIGGDPLYFHGLAQLLAGGHGWNEPYQYWYLLGVHPTATHPPLYPLLLALSSKLGFGTVFAHRMVSCAAGAAAIPLVALAARRYGGPRAGLIAAGIAALYPYLWLNDVSLLSESLLAGLVALVLLAAEAAAREPSLRRGVWLGAVIALAALTRAEQLLLVPLLAWPLLARGRDAWRARLTRVGAATVAALVVIMPWVGWNLTRFDHPVLMSTDLGATVFNTNCDRVWHGALIGWWTYVPHCPDDVSLEQAPDASTRELRLRAAGLRYVRAHLRRAPVVVAARVGREWGIYRPNQTRHLDERSDGNRWPSLAGFVGFYVLILLSIPGLVFVRRRHLSVLPFAALAATVTITAACFYGSPRFRTPVEVGAVVLAAVAIDGLLETPARRRGAAERDVDSAPAPTALAPAGSGELTPVR